MIDALTPAQIWWTADEIAAAALPDLPGSKRNVNAHADRMGWRCNASLARRRSGRGGGWEYSWLLFPSRAQRKLLQDVVGASVAARPARDDVWAWFETLPQSVKAKAETRLLIIQKVDALEPAIGRHMAVSNVARLDGIAARTLWNWLSLIEGVRPDDRLAYLAPRHRADSGKKTQVKDCSPEFFDQLKGDFLRLEAPPFTDCYRRALRVAKAQGWDILPERTMRRRMDASVSEATQVLARKGVDAVKRMYPVQVRDKSCLHALQAVNADFHKFDVFVRWPAPFGSNEPGQILRPQMVAFQDIYSGRILAWRVGYADYAAWCGGAWLPEDGLWSLGSSQYMDDFGGVADLDLNSEIADLASVTEVRISYVPEETSISGAVLVDGEWIVTGNDFTGVSALSPVGHASYEVLTVRVYRLGLLAESFPIRVLVINVGDTENRRVLFTDAVFGYPAWRIARACAETGSAPAWVIKNNQSLNSIFAGHSTMVSFLFGTTEWQVGGVLGEGASADANLHMDGLYSAEIMMQKLAALAATGNPNGAYHYDGFTLFSDPATRPTDGGAITGSMTPYALSQPDMADTFGKAAPGTKLLNAGTFYPNQTLDLDGTLHPANTLDFESTRQCKITRETLGGAYLEYLGLLEP